MRNKIAIFTSSANNIDMKTLYYFIGYPASGKTTLAKEMKEKYHCDYISTDDVFNDLFDEGKKYSEILKLSTITVLDKILKTGRKSKNVLLDTFKPYAHERAVILNSLPDTYVKIAVVMDTPLEECIRRYNKREKLKEDSVPGFANEKIEMPTLNEFNAIITSSELEEYLRRQP